MYAFFSDKLPILFRIRAANLLIHGLLSGKILPDLIGIINLIYFQIKPTDIQIFPVDDANRVFKRLNSCEIHGRAVLEVSPF